MSKTLKSMMTDALRSRYEGVEEACVVDISRLDVADTIKFRRALCERQMKVNVVKNSLARRAFSGSPLEPLGNALNGPCALVIGGDSVIDVAKELVRLAKELPKVEPREALLPGEVELLPVSELAKFKSQRELVAEIAMLVSSPGRSVAGCLAGAQSRLAGCLKAMAEGSEKSEEAAA